MSIDQEFDSLGHERDRHTTCPCFGELAAGNRGIVAASREQSKCGSSDLLRATSLDVSKPSLNG